MRNIVKLFFISILLFGFYEAKADDISRKAMLDSMKTIDSEVKKYFPRWKICEPDLQIQIFKTFQLLGYPEKELDLTQIEVLAIPRTQDNMYDPYEILTISCGRTYMNASEIESNMGVLLDYISGATSYLYDYQPDFPTRDYCYVEIPPSTPLTENQIVAITNYLEPTNVTHSFSISLFEQSIKIGESYFWVKSIFGTDQVGYPFWSSGEAKVLLKRPLYVNKDSRTQVLFPTLITAHLGGGYRTTSGLKNESGLFDFLPNRVLNGAPNGKLIAGFDFNMPFHPFIGLSVNLEAPIKSQSELTIDVKSFGSYEVPVSSEDLPLVEPIEGGPHSEDVISAIVPVLQTTGQVTVFYNWWLNREEPENYFRFDLGMSYQEVQEHALFNISAGDPDGRKKGDYITTEGIRGLKLYKPAELGDWLFMKAEYRNQSAFPFGMSVQYSNQIFLGRLYIPLLSPWLYLEAKYATPLRGVRPYEVEHFFMLSPVLRITI